MQIYLYLFNLLLLSLQVYADNSKIENFLKANRKFTSSVYQQVIKQSSDNLLVCPLSAQIILGLARFGAKGNTAKELALYIEDHDDPKGIFLELNKILENTKKCVLSSASNIFLNNKYSIKKQFRNTAFNDFKADVQNVDFSRIEETVDYINSWVEKRTNYKINKMLSKEHILPSTAAILVNTLYFYGYWINQFNPDCSYAKEFYINDETVVETETMFILCDFNYYDNNELNAQFLEMPFQGDDITMTFVLPNEKFGLQNLEERISEVLLPQNYTEEEVYVSLPMFKIQSEINLKPILQSMGVKDAFTPTADFSDISDVPYLFIDQVVQKTFLEINEKGATAAASTSLRLIPYNNPENEFEADHPFLFFMRHKTNGIMFIGRFVAPTV